MRDAARSKTSPGLRDIEAEYRFDYSVSRPNRFAEHSDSADSTVKVDPDVPEGD